jgi:hypothetical protein
MLKFIWSFWLSLFFACVPFFQLLQPIKHRYPPLLRICHFPIRAWRLAWQTQQCVGAVNYLKVYFHPRLIVVRVHDVDKVIKQWRYRRVPKLYQLMRNVDLARDIDKLIAD